MIKKNLDPLVSALLDEKFPGYSFALFHGSRVKGTSRENSDYDLIVLYHEKITCYREHFEYSGKPIDAFVYDIPAFNFKMQSGAAVGNFVLASIVEDVVVYPKDTAESDFLIEKGRSLLKGPRVEIPKIAAIMTYQYLCNCIEDLENTVDVTMRLFIAIDLFKYINDFLLIRCNQGGSVRKHAALALEKNSSEYYNMLHPAFSEAIKGNNAKIIALAKKILSAFPDEYKEFYKVELPIHGRLALNI